MNRLVLVASFCLAVSGIILGVLPGAARAKPATRITISGCPFCSAINLTFTEQIASNDVVVIARMTEAPHYDEERPDDLPKATFEVTDIVKGEVFVKSGSTFQTVLVGNYAADQLFMVMGVSPPNVIWSTPLKASERVIDYVRTLDDLPESGAGRLEFFQNYFEDEESVLAFDAYDEFARCDYADLIALKDKMDREKLLGWINDPATALNRKKLYLTMLGVCGQPEDVVMLEEMIKSNDRQKRAGLDAIVGCYLILKGAEGLPMIEQALLKNKEVDYVETLAAVTAIRFMGTESKLIPRERLAQALRTLLDRPEVAEMVLPDLARWEDWSVLDRVPELFEGVEGDPQDSVWMRVAIFTYLMQCPLDRAKILMKELKEKDPKAYERATFFDNFGGETIDSGTGSDGESGSASDGLTTNHDPFPGGETVFVTAASQAVQLESQPVLLDVESEAAESPEVGEIDRLVEPEFQKDPESARTVLKPPVDDSADEVGLSSSPVSGVSGKDLVESAPAISPPATLVGTRAFFRVNSVLLPVGSSLAIFLLMWSVINGWFERLIF